MDTLAMILWGLLGQHPRKLAPKHKPVAFNAQHLRHPQGGVGAHRSLTQPYKKMQSKANLKFSLKKNLAFSKAGYKAALIKNGILTKNAPNHNTRMSKASPDLKHTITRKLRSGAMKHL